MNYEITENQLLSLINRVIVKSYGQELVMNKTDGDYYIKFTIPGIVDKDGDEEILFYKNYWGILWINDTEIVKKIRGLFGFDGDEIKKYLIKYFETKYDIKIKNVVYPYDGNNYD
jgi:hypothetical protein